MTFWNGSQVGIPAGKLLLPVHGDGELQLVPAAGHSGLARITALRAAHLQVLSCYEALLWVTIQCIIAPQQASAVFCLSSHYGCVGFACPDSGPHISAVALTQCHRQMTQC